MAKPKVTSTDINITYNPTTVGLTTGTSTSGWVSNNPYNEYLEFIDYCRCGKKEELNGKEPKDDSPSIEAMVSVIKNPKLTMRERVDKLIKKIK